MINHPANSHLITQIKDPQSPAMSGSWSNVEREVSNISPQISTSKLLLAFCGLWNSPVLEQVNKRFKTLFFLESIYALLCGWYHYHLFSLSLMYPTLTSYFCHSSSSFSISSFCFNLFYAVWIQTHVAHLVVTTTLNTNISNLVPNDGNGVWGQSLTLLFYIKHRNIKRVL